MPEIVRNEKFLVHEQGESVWNGPTVQSHLWFEVLEGADAGIRVGVPLGDEPYDDLTHEQLKALADGDVVRATLRRENKRDQWTPTEPPEIIAHL